MVSNLVLYDMTLMVSKLLDYVCRKDISKFIMYIFYVSLQQPTLSDMTMYELNFSLLVEQMLSRIVDPAYRQIMVEVSVYVFVQWIIIVKISHNKE